MNNGVLSLATILSCTSPNTDTAELHPQIIYPAEALETGDLHYASSFSASRVDLHAYYFFVNDTAYCLSPLQDVTATIAAYNLSGVMYVPPFSKEQGTFDDIPLHIKEWGTIYIGLNDVIFQQNTPVEAVFYDPLGDSTEEREHRPVKDYAVVASSNLYAPFVTFVATREVRPSIDVFLCE